MFVDPFGWDELGVSVVGGAGLPGALVEVSVVVAAEQDAVVEGGRAALAPGHDVVGVAPRGWAFAAGEGAAAVAEFEELPDLAGIQPHSVGQALPTGPVTSLGASASRDVEPTPDMPSNAARIRRTNTALRCDGGTPVVDVMIQT